MIERGGANADSDVSRRDVRHANVVTELELVE
jgi:hypothetical protein